MWEIVKKKKEMQIEPGKVQIEVLSVQIDRGILQIEVRSHQIEKGSGRTWEGHGDGSHVLLKVELEEETKGPLAGIDAAGLTSSE